jgi:peptidoglycan/LPS O-acetylase OafA/YrhL
VKDPTQSIQAIFSFFGQFGVQAFVFLSAYGLAKSHWNDPSDWATFMWSRVKKLYPMFGLAMFTWLFLMSLHFGPLVVIRERGLEFFFMLTGLSNILPGYLLPPVGPWWWIPFIIQFYAIWPLLRRLTIKFGWQGLLALSILSLIVTYAVNPVLGRWQIDLLETPIARLPVLCLGIGAARYPLRLNAGLISLSFALVLLGSVYALVWPFTLPAGLILILSIYLRLRKRLKASELLECIGHYALPIFLFNGIVRIPFVESARSPLSQLVFGCLSALASFTVSVSIQELLVPERIRGFSLFRKRGLIRPALAGDHAESAPTANTIPSRY